MKNISESTKLTLTFGQLKRLVKEFKEYDLLEEGGIGRNEEEVATFFFDKMTESTWSGRKAVLVTSAGVKTVGVEEDSLPKDIKKKTLQETADAIIQALGGKNYVVVLMASTFGKPGDVYVCYDGSKTGLKRDFMVEVKSGSEGSRIKNLSFNTFVRFNTDAFNPDKIGHTSRKYPGRTSHTGRNGVYTEPTKMVSHQYDYSTAEEFDLEQAYKGVELFAKPYVDSEPYVSERQLATINNELNNSNLGITLRKLLVCGLWSGSHAKAGDERPLVIPPEIPRRGWEDTYFLRIPKFWETLQAAVSFIPLIANNFNATVPTEKPDEELEDIYMSRTVLSPRDLEGMSFSDVVKTWRKSGIAEVDFIGLGYGDDITFYSVGKTKIQMTSEKGANLASSLSSEFNRVYISTWFRTDGIPKRLGNTPYDGGPFDKQPPSKILRLVGKLDFGKKQAASTRNPELKIKERPGVGD